MTYPQRWQELHGTTPSPLVRRWLAAVEVLGAPLARLGVHPHLLTGAALVVAAAVPVVPAPGAAALVLLSALLDALDGCVAALQDRASRWGAVLDSTADRVADGLFVLALVLAGGPAWLGVLAASAAQLLEYARARAGVVGTVTLAERPARVLVPCVALALGLPTAGLWLLAVVGAVGLLQLAPALRRQLASE
ncbi:MAG: CDP-alcohol phosphatidyltransferase family protein [Mycobacteriales bacterium]